MAIIYMIYFLKYIRLNAATCLTKFHILVRSSIKVYFFLLVPNPVVSLTVSPLSTSSVKLQWTDPVDVKSYYSYRVQYSNATGPVGEKTVITSSAVVPGLEPGTGYTFTVTTVAAAGTNGILEQTFSYTSKLVF